MASTQPLTSLIDAKSETCSVFRCKIKNRPPNLCFHSVRLRRTLVFDVLGDSTRGYSRWCSSFGKPWSIKAVRAGSSMDSGENGDGKETEDAFSATIEKKSKEVVAMQRELLQQISESKKVVSSIKSSFITLEKNDVSQERSNELFPLSDPVSKSVEPLDGHTTRTPKNDSSDVASEAVPSYLPHTLNVSSQKNEEREDLRKTSLEEDSSEVVAPRYGDYSEAQSTGVYKNYKVDGQDFEVTYFQAFIDGVDFVFMDSPLFRHLGNNIYVGNRQDILKRMVLFCKAAVEVKFRLRSST